MRILTDLISTLDGDVKVVEVHTCAFWTAVMTQKCGLAHTLLDERAPHAANPVRDAGELTQKSALALAEYAKSSNPLEASIGVATINSMLEVDQSRCRELDAFELLEEQGQGKKVAIVGHFPFVGRLRGIASQLWVIERTPWEGELPESEAAQVIPQADVVAITGSALINQTLEELLTLCSPHSFTLILGPSTPLSPILFDYGADALSGIVVTDPETVLCYISQGATFRQMKGKGVRLVTIEKST